MNNKVVKSLLRSAYSLKELELIRKFFEQYETLKLYRMENGLYAALSSQEKKSVSGYTYSWVRDTVMITNYQRETGNYQIAAKTVSTLSEYFHRHRNRFLDIIEGRADKNNPLARPHIRFMGETLEEIDQKWAHAQNDALGYFLWMMFKLANDHHYSLTVRDQDVCALFPPYFDAIEYWHDEDSGHWEEARKVESSSIGVVVAALEEMKNYIIKERSVGFSCGHREISINYLQKLIDLGRAKLENFLPYESPPRRKADAALLFLLYPLEAVTHEHGMEILHEVLLALKGDYGIKRYEGDSYWCASYKKLIREEERTVDFSDDMQRRNMLLIPGTEAQWCIFDPVVSVIYAKKYIETREKEYLKLQTHYFNRALAQLTPEDFPLGGCKCAEAYYIEDSDKGIYVPNDHVPLAWTQANLGIAFEYMKKTREYR